MGRKVGLARNPIGEPEKKIIDAIKRELLKQNFIAK
jgi:hypothetical protein